MNLQSHYNALYTKAITLLNTNAYTLDPLIESKTDKRFGITLVIRPSMMVKAEIQDFINTLKVLDPNQYYYPNSDIHITVMSIISCRDGFSLDQITVDDYVAVINKCLKNIGAFKVQFKGVTASDSCVMIQGFLESNTLNILRDNLRLEFNNIDLVQSIDVRYSIQTAHATVVRYKHKISNKNKYIDQIAAYRDYNFGTFKVNALELVYNDWYQRAQHVKKLHEFEIY